VQSTSNRGEQFNGKKEKKRKLPLAQQAHPGSKRSPGHEKGVMEKKKKESERPRPENKSPIFSGKKGKRG